MTESAYTVTGMTCEHCVRSVTAEVAKLPGVTEVDVDLSSGQVRVASEHDLDRSAVEAAVEEAGFEVAG